MRDLLEAAREAVALARTAGAQDAWAGASRSRSVETQLRDGKLEKVQESTSRSLGLELYVDGRYSSHSTTDLRPDRLRGFIEEAVAMTRALQVDPARQIPDPALFANRPQAALDLVDAQVGGITQAQRVAWCEALDAATHTNERVISATSWVNDDHSISASVSSNGFEGTYEGTSVWLGADVTVRDEGDRRPEDGSWAGARHLPDLPEAGQIGAEALVRTTARLGSAKVSSRKATMVVDNRSAGRLIGMLLAPANARALHTGRSFWAGRVGQKVGSAALSITDDPLLPRGFGSRLFDSEGISARALPLIEQGVARNLYVDTYYGRKLGLVPTTGSGSNRVVTPGSDAPAALLKKVGTGVLVTGWLGGNSDATTGDFSLGVQGHLIENGQVGAPVGEMNITGNLLDLFGQLVAVGNDPWRYSGTLTPTLVFEGVSFSGT